MLYFLCMRSNQHQRDDFQKEKVLVLYRRIYNLFIKKCLLEFTISLLRICIVQHCTKLVFSLYKDGVVLFVDRPELTG